MDGVDGVGGGGVRDGLLYATFGTLHGRRSFAYAGERYRYHAARYNATWANERTVELPIALRLLSRHAGGRVLEVGNVLHHYVDEQHDVVDKYEQATGVRNVDVLDFLPTRPYDLIVSISRSSTSAGTRRSVTRTSRRAPWSTSPTCWRLVAPSW